MTQPILFIATVLIWGTSWYAIGLQVGPVPVVVSVFYRMALAAILMLAGLALLGQLRLPRRWRFVLVQALCLFSFNFVAFYQAAASIPTGLISVIFSLASIFNALNAWAMFGERINAQVFMAGLFGASGVALMFWHDLAGALDGDVLRGIGWAILGTLLFSWGNMASRRNSAEGVGPVTANAWGLGIGALVLLIFALATGQPLIAPPDRTYWLALLYLAAFASVAGFTVYLILVVRIGSARAGYATVLFPVVALTLSTLFEGYHWTPAAIAGVGLALMGNLVMFWRPGGLRRRA